MYFTFHTDLMQYMLVRDLMLCCMFYEEELDLCMCSGHVTVCMCEQAQFPNCIDLIRRFLLTFFGIASSLFSFCSPLILPFIFSHSALEPQPPPTRPPSLQVWPSLILVPCMSSSFDPLHPSLSQASFCFNETDVPSLIKTRSTTVMKE